MKVVKAIVRYIGQRGALPRYLLLQKAEDSFFPQNIGKWECVGGFIDKGETPERAIMKELEEETNLEGRIVKQLPTLESDKSICYVYLVDAASNNVKISSEHSDYRWMRAEDVKNQDLVLYADLLLEFFNNAERYLN
jgi:8-oxo-dGTP diphosphatase